MTVDAKSNAPIHQRRLRTTRGGWTVSVRSIPSDLGCGMGIAKSRCSATSKLDQLVRRERGKDELGRAITARHTEDLATLHGAGRTEVAGHGDPDLRHRHRF